MELAVIGPSHQSHIVIRNPVVRKQADNVFANQAVSPVWPVDKTREGP